MKTRIMNKKIANAREYKLSATVEPIQDLSVRSRRTFNVELNRILNETFSALVTHSVTKRSEMKT